MVLISGTYSDNALVDSMLDKNLYDQQLYQRRKEQQAVLAKAEVNNYVGRQSDFTSTQLADTRYAGIVKAASQLTAYFMELKYQEGGGRVSEETKRDREDAYATLRVWMLNNGLTPPEEKAKQKRDITETPVWMRPSDTCYIF